MRFFSNTKVAALLLALLATAPAWSASAQSASTQGAPAQIALLLPQSGRMAKAAEAIRDGFLAAYYQDSGKAADSPSLRFYDSDSQDIVSLLAKVKAEGATIAIGPLDRERLDKLVKAGPLPLPVLALNSVEASADNLYQFALAPEDEILRLVQWLDQQKIRQPLILSAADEGSQRLQKLFQAAWQAGHDTVPKVITLDPARKGGIVADIRDITRQGGRLDALFLAAPALARQVQPALTYFHSNLPLYSLSSAWDPTADASGQKDLDGLRFCDLPWMLDAARPEQDALYQSFTRPVSGYDRLQAFGADAWTLVKSWSALEDGEPLSLRSGRVQAGPNRHLRRIPSCAEVRNGTALVVWSPDGSSR